MFCNVINLFHNWLSLIAFFLHNRINHSINSYFTKRSTDEGFLQKHAWHEIRRSGIILWLAPTAQVGVEQWKWLARFLRIPNWACQTWPTRGMLDGLKGETKGSKWQVQGSFIIIGQFYMTYLRRVLMTMPNGDMLNLLLDTCVSRADWWLMWLRDALADERQVSYNKNEWCRIDQSSCVRMMAMGVMEWMECHPHDKSFLRTRNVTYEARATVIELFPRNENPRHQDYYQERKHVIISWWVRW